MPETDHDRILEIERLADVLYESHAEGAARKFGKAGALTFYAMMGRDVRNFWRGLAQQIIDHSSHWEPNDGCACVLDDDESERLSELPRVFDDDAIKTMRFPR